MLSKTKVNRKLGRGSGIRNRLREYRLGLGLSQADLASRVDITRQALYAVEMNQYLPGTEVALKLATILGCTVEDLFLIEARDEIIEADWVGNRQVGEDSARVKIASVDGRVLAKPVSDLGGVLNYTVPADGIQLGRNSNHSQVLDSSNRIYVRLLKPLQDIERQIVVAGCDPAICLAGEHIRQHGGDASVLGWGMGSLAALHALKRGEVHIAVSYTHLTLPTILLV